MSAMQNHRPEDGDRAQTSQEGRPESPPASSEGTPVGLPAGAAAPDTLPPLEAVVPTGGGALPDDAMWVVRTTGTVTVFRASTGDFYLDAPAEKRPPIRLAQEDARAVAYALLGWVSTIPTEPRRGPTL